MTHLCTGRWSWSTFNQHKLERSILRVTINLYMLFNSWQFAIFFPIVVMGFFCVPHPARWVWLLLSSCAFYACYIPEYLLILLLTIGVDYAAGILIERTSG